MTPTEYTVQEHIAELQRVAAQVRLAREVRRQSVVALWLNRLFAALRLRRPDRRLHTQPEITPVSRAAQPCAALPGGAT